jgi:protein arginine N-methyltransferase 1
LGLVVDAAAGVRERLRRIPWIRRLAYDLRNRRLFTDLYQHEKMLSDRSRIEKYHEAIARHVGPEAVVLDLGTGSGILSFFAAAQGPRVVHAIEHSSVIELAQAVAAANGIEGIEFHRVHSQDFTIDEPATVLIHEQIGEWVFDENMVANISDLRDRVLAPGGVILPAHFEVFVEPVQTTEDARVPFIWEQQIHGVSFASLKKQSDQARDSFRYRAKLLWAEQYDRLLAEPQPAITFDLTTLQPDDLPRSLSVRRTVSRAGRLDGFCLYFVARFDDMTSFSNSPEATPTHWMIPWLRTPARTVQVGDVVSLELTMPDIADPVSWRWKAG